MKPCLVFCLVLLARTIMGAEPALNFEPNIPVLFLQTKTPLQVGQKQRGLVSVKYPKNSAAPDAGSLPAEIKYRGAVSLGYEKKSLALDFDDALALGGLPARTHWVLNAAFVDRSMMRHKLAFDLFAAMSAPGAKRHAASSRFVEVFLDGNYRGAYLLTERVDRKLLDFRRYRAEDAEHASIYKGVDHSAVFNQNGHDGYEQHAPDPKTKEYWQPLDELNRFANRSREAAFLDPKTGLGTRLDLADAMDFHLHLLMACNKDGPSKNFILARDGAKTGPAPLFFFVPWDCDATFGRDWNGSRVGPNHWLSNYLFDRLLENADYRKQFAARWTGLRLKQFSNPALAQMIDDNVRALGPAAQRNEARWREQLKYLPDRLTFDQDIAQMHIWVRNRAEWLDRQIAQVATR